MPDPTCDHCGRTHYTVAPYVDYDERGRIIGGAYLCVNRTACWERWFIRYGYQPMMGLARKETTCKSTDSTPPTIATAHV